ncbi:MAG: EFR1 family ferrodoxin [Clostridium sp.]|uniref:EFR1 family ferrodoxin n=1 Tax=Clostridium sp. TaxID=1506 RepID=UPI002FCB5B56
MKGSIVYFSGTGNTEFVARLFKDKFKENEVEIKNINIIKKKNITDDYDFLILAAPVYVDLFPRYFIDYLVNKLPEGNNRSAIIISTPGGNSSVAIREVREILQGKSYKVAIEAEVLMPNNFFLAKGFKKPTKEEVNLKKEGAKDHVDRIVNGFLNNVNTLVDCSKVREIAARPIHNIFTKKYKTWAKKNLTVDMDKCVMCSKCSKNCPTKNITVADEFIFREDCIGCLKCVHTCPVNAFLYKGHKIDQYRL